MVEAGQGHQLDELLLGEVPAQRRPERVVHPRVVVERVHEAHEQALPLRERGRIAARDGGQLGRGEPHPLGEEGHVHPPLVLAAAAGAGAVDDDLALAQRQVALVEQPAAHEALEQALVAGEHAEQDEGRDAGRHQGIEADLDICRIRGVRRGDAGACGHDNAPVLLIT